MKQKYPDEVVICESCEGSGYHSPGPDRDLGRLVRAAEFAARLFYPGSSTAKELRRAVKGVKRR